MLGSSSPLLLRNRPTYTRGRVGRCHSKGFPQLPRISHVSLASLMRTHASSSHMRMRLSSRHLPLPHPTDRSVMVAPSLPPPFSQIHHCHPLPRSPPFGQIRRLRPLPVPPPSSHIYQPLHPPRPSGNRGCRSSSQGQALALGSGETHVLATSRRRGHTGCPSREAQSHLAGSRAASLARRRAEKSRVGAHMCHQLPQSHRWDDHDDIAVIFVGRVDPIDLCVFNEELMAVGTTVVSARI